MSEEDDDAQKTEEPTERRLEEAFKKGKVVFSREVTNFLVLFTFTIFITWFIPYSSKKFSTNFSYYLSNSYQIKMDEGNLGLVFIKIIQDISITVILPFMVTIIVAILSSFLQNQGRFLFSLDILSFDLSKISILKGIKRLFSAKSVVECLKSFFKIILVGIVCYIAIKAELPKVRLLHEYSIIGIINFIFDLSIDILIAVSIIMAAIAALDYLYQSHEFYKSMRMSKQELKDEYKQSEGNPEVKGKLKRLRRERAKRRMMADIPKADVVITNPTHFAVALKYDQGKMRAPNVIAKGQDLIALKIREVAKEHDIPIVEDPPLARALYANVDLDEEIPLEYYETVAKIISYVYKLKNK